jgi:hypothetical protein
MAEILGNFATAQNVAGSIEGEVSQLSQSFQSQHGLEFNSAPNRNEYQEPSWGQWTIGNCG